MESKLRQIVWLLSANLAVTLVFVAVVVLGLMPKAQRALDATERVEARFQSFADDVQPVIKSGAGKAVDAIEGMDTKGLSERANEVVDAAAERAKRALEKDKE